MDTPTSSQYTEQPSSGLFGNSPVSSHRLVDNPEEINEFIEIEKMSVTGDSKLSSSLLHDPKDRFKKVDLLSKRVHERFQNNAEKIMNDSLFQSEATPTAKDTPAHRERSSSAKKRSPLNRLGSAKSIHSRDKPILEPIEETNYHNLSAANRIAREARSTSKKLKKAFSKVNLAQVARKRSPSRESLDKQERMAKKGIGSPKLQIGKYDMLKAKGGHQTSKYVKEKVKVTVGQTSEEKHGQHIIDTKSAYSNKSIEIPNFLNEKGGSSRKIGKMLSGPISKINSREGSHGKMSTEDMLAPLNKILGKDSQKPVHNRKLVQQKSMEINLTSASRERNFLKKGAGLALKKTIGTKTYAELDSSNMFKSHKTIPLTVPKPPVPKVDTKTLLQIPQAVMKTKPGQNKGSKKSIEKPGFENVLSKPFRDNLPSDIGSRDHTLNEQERLDDSDINLLKKASCKLLPNIGSKDIVSDSFDDILLKEARFGGKSEGFMKGLASEYKITLEEALAQMHLIIKEHFNQRREKVIIEMMYLELYVKKYKEAILINLDVCMKQALQHLKIGTWESIRSLKLDTYFANLDHTEEVKRSIKKIYEIQKIDFSQFSSRPTELEGFRGEFLEDLILEIAKADVFSNADPSVKTHLKDYPRMLCNDTLDLSIINAQDGLHKGLVSMLDSAKKNPEPLLGQNFVKPDSKLTGGSSSKQNLFRDQTPPRRRGVGEVRSAEIKKYGSFNKQPFKEESKRNTDKFNLFNDTSRKY